MKPRKACERKRRYETKAAAKAERTQAKDGAYMETVYPCHFCGGWHKTKNIEVLKKRRRKNERLELSE